MKLTVLGCSGTYAGPDNACSGYLVETEDTAVLMDCGPGTVSMVQRFRPLESLDAIVVSHSHPDHWAELLVLRNAYRWVIERIGVPVFGTEETRSSLAALSRDDDHTYDWTTITASSELEIGGLGLRFSRTDHPPETLAIRIDADGRSLAYSADTGPGWTMADLGDGIDLALCEATYLHRDRGRSHGAHLSAHEAGDMCRSAGVGSVLLTHQIPGSTSEDFRAEASAAYGAPVHVARPGATYDV